MRSCAAASRDVGLRHFELRHGFVTLALARRVLFEQRHDAIALAARLVEPRLGDAEFRTRLRDGGAIGLRIDPEQQVALADRAAFLVPALEQDAADARAHFDVARPHGTSACIPAAWARLRS